MSGLKSLDPRAWRYVEGRLFEWVISILMAAIGSQLLIWPGLQKSASFIELSDLGVAGEALAFFLIFFGIARICALVANGRSKVWGPRTRAVGAIAGALVWIQFAYSIIVNFQDATPQLGAPFWILFTVGELYSAYRAEVDARTTKS